jgi:F-type H+-transporting ATPase subunit a
MRTFEYILMLDPLEQFDLTKLGNINILQSGLFFSCAYTYALVAKAKKSDFYDLKHKNLSMRCILDFIFNAIKGSLHIKRHNMLVGVGLTFIYILMCNCIGLVPYTFTNTSSLVVTFYLAIMLFGGINIISIFINS